MEYKIPPGKESSFVINRNKSKPTKIDPTKPFEARLDLSAYVDFKGDRYSCRACGEVLVRIEPNGILGQELNQLDTTVVLDHHLAFHNC